MGLHICNGEQLPVQQNAELFGLLGYRFGGDSKTQKFALPKLYAPDNYHYEQYFLVRRTREKHLAQKGNKIPLSFSFSKRAATKRYSCAGR